MAGDKFLEAYSGESPAQLIALEATHRIDSLVLAFEQGIGMRPNATDLSSLTTTERAVLAIEALEREVNNGGYGQFFSNTDDEFNPHIVDALEQIGCPLTAQITRDALDAKQLPADAQLQALHECDKRYDNSGEPIADRLFTYIKSHVNDVRLP
jgi:hypothetical protein